MNLWGRLAATGAAGVLASYLLASCGNSPTAGHKAASNSTLDTTAKTTTTTTTTTVPPTSSTVATTTTAPGIPVPNVIGLKIAAAHSALRGVGLHSVELNVPCNRGTLASQSVVASLSIAGEPPNASVGAVPVSPGADVPSGTRIGITWSGCYGTETIVPVVVGLTYSAGRHALTSAGLTWACFSVGAPATTTTTTTTTDTTAGAAVTTTTVKHHPQTVLSQNPPPGIVLKPGATVSFTMPTCPQ